MTIESSRSSIFSIPMQSLKRQGKRLRTVFLRRAPTGRHAVFAKAFDGKPKVHVANRRAKEISLDATYDADIFIGLVTDYIRLVSP